MKKIISLLLSISIIIGCLFTANSVYAYTFENSAGDFTVSTIDLSRPTMLQRGEGFLLYGNLIANKKLKKLKITVEDLDQFQKEISFSRTISGKSVNLRDYAEQIRFSRLPSGEKELKIILVADDGSRASCSRRFTVLGKANEPKHITDKCTFKVTAGRANYATDSNLNTLWTGGTMTIRLPKNKKVDGILINWRTSTNNYTLKSYDKSGRVLDNYDGKKLYFLNQYYSLNEKATKVIIKLKKKEDRGIAQLRVYEKGMIGVSVQKWEKPKNDKCDLMVISCHRDDELLFFGGTIPYYQNVKGKTVYTMYVSGKETIRGREALDGQWSMGSRTYPIFMYFPGGYHSGVEGTLKSWGGENRCLEKMVEKIRRYKPKVIVTHDEKGEYGHPSHITTSYLVTQAVNYAGDKTKFPASYRKYGLCNVQKVYKHYTDKNTIRFNWDRSYPQLDDKSPFEIATIAFDKHRSQHGNWSMTCETVRKYPNNQFGLVYSRVGSDTFKNDFFEHVK